jgi:hypothetical protein
VVSSAQRMKRRSFLGVVTSFLTLIVFAAAAFPPSALAGTANGGGHGTVDGTTPFSQFGFGVTTNADGSVRGSFNCLMAGAAQFPGFTLMAVRGQVTHVVMSGAGASFDGAGMLQTGPDGKFPATFHVEVTEGGPGVGTLQLTLLTPFVFVMPTEHVLNGQISIH